MTEESRSCRGVPLSMVIGMLLLDKGTDYWFPRLITSPDIPMLRPFVGILAGLLVIAGLALVIEPIWRFLNSKDASESEGGTESEG